MKRLIQILQLDHKWVRVMLSTSTILILLILFFPMGLKQEAILQSEEYPAPAMADSVGVIYDAPIVDTTFRTTDTTNTRIIIRRRQPMEIGRPLPARPAPVTADKSNEDTALVSDAPLKVQIVQEKKPFDWKGTITWAIGAMNGLVLIILNVKNLLFKKNT